MNVRTIRQIDRQTERIHAHYVDIGFGQAHPNYSPARASQLVAYQRIITPANNCYSLAAWLNYDVQFWTLAVPDPFLMLECLTYRLLVIMCNINPFTSNPLALSTLWSNKPLSCKLSFSPVCHTNIFKWTTPLPPFLQPQWAANLPPSRGQLNYRPFTCHALTVQPAAIKTAHPLTAVYSVVPTTAPSTASAKGSLAQ